MRIIAGRFRGHALTAPQGRTIRPTSDRLRETLFNLLAHGHGDPVPGARVLDLFAGTGALGLEALSRGGASCLFVDHGAEARALIRGNVEALGLGGVTRVLRRDAAALGTATSPLATLVFLDPPYGAGLAERALVSAAAGGWLAPDALMVVEEAAQAAFEPPAGFTLLDRRASGDSQLLFLAYKAQTGGGLRSA